MASDPVAADREALEQMRQFAERHLAQLDAVATDVPPVVFETESDIQQWWHLVADQDIMQMLPKITEYGGTEEGSADLQIMGNALAELMGMHDAPDAIKQEMACWFYALGKISRLVSDYKQGKPGKADTWHDLTVYSMMARRLQAVGRWP